MNDNAGCAHSQQNLNDMLQALHKPTIPLWRYAAALLLGAAQALALAWPAAWALPPILPAGAVLWWLQIGATAGLYALQYQVTRLAEDHDKARELATLLTAIPPLQVKYSKSQTNMVFAEMEERHADPLAQWLKKEGILVNPGKIMRMVMHLDVAPGAVSQIAEAIKSYFQQAECKLNLPATGNNTKEVRYF